MGSTVPKQFMLLGGVPLLIHSLRVLDSSDLVSEIILAVREDDRDSCATEVAARYGLTKVGRVVPGGAERQESVRRALEAVGEDVELAVVHDAVRPFLTEDMVVRVVERARAVGGAILAVPMRDTVKAMGPDGMIRRTVEREHLWLAQTPQAFNVSLLREVHTKAKAEGVHATDDAELFERYGHPVAVVEGGGDNIKVTRPEDLEMAEAILAARRRS